MNASLCLIIMSIVILIFSLLHLYDKSIFLSGILVYMAVLRVVSGDFEIDATVIKQERMKN